MFKLRKLYSKPISVIMLLMMSAIVFSGCSFTYDLDTTVSDAKDVLQYEETFDTEEDIFTDIDTQAETEIQSEHEVSEEETVYYTFRNDKLLNEHFEKHNEDFGYADVQEYVEGANRVINDKNALHKLEAEDGDDVYYLENTNEFVIVSTDGYIRTYFNPNRGIDYYNSQ